MSFIIIIVTTATLVIRQNQTGWNIKIRWLSFFPLTQCLYWRSDAVGKSVPEGGIKDALSIWSASPSERNAQLSAQSGRKEKPRLEERERSNRKKTREKRNIEPGREGVTERKGEIAVEAV